MRRSIALVSLLCCLSACTGSERDLAYWRAVNAIDDGRHDLARAYLSEFLQARGDDEPLALEARRLLGRAWLQGALQSAGNAEPVWRELLAAAPGDEEALLALARISHILGDEDQALQILENGSLPESEEREALLGAVLLRAAPERALEWAARGFEENPRASLVAAEAADLLGDDAALLEYARLAVLDQPLNPASHYLLSRALSRAGNREGASAAIRLHSLVKRLVATQGATQETVLERLRVAEALAPELPGPPGAFLRLRLDLLVEAGLREEGSRRLVEALAADDHQGASYSQLAGWAERLGDLATARELLEAELGDESDPRLRRLIEHRLGRIYRVVDEDLAVDFLRAALAEQPNVARFHCALGGSLATQGAEDEAVEHYRRSLDLAPWRADCRIELARLLQAGGERDSVARLLQAAPEPAAELQRFREDFGYLER